MSLKKKKIVKLERQAKKDFLVLLLVFLCVVLPLVVLIAMYSPQQAGIRKK